MLKVQLFEIVFTNQSFCLMMQVSTLYN